MPSRQNDETHARREAARISREEDHGEPRSNERPPTDAYEDDDELEDPED